MSRWWGVWPVFAMYVALLCIVLSITRAADRAVAERYASFSTTVIVSEVAFSILVLGLLLGTNAFVPNRLRLTAGRQTWHQLFVMLVGSLAAERVVRSLINIGSQGGDPPSPRMSFAAADLMRLNSLWEIPLVVSIVLVMAFVVTAEEIFFRGYMQGRLRERLGPAWAVAITSTCFGLGHSVSLEGAGAVVGGVYYGYVTELSGSIRPAILCHLVYNVFWKVLWRVAPHLVVFGSAGELATTVINKLLTSMDIGGVSTNVVWLAVGGTVLAGCIVWLRQTLPRT